MFASFAVGFFSGGIGGVNLRIFDVVGGFQLFGPSLFFLGLQLGLQSWRLRGKSRVADGRHSAGRLPPIGFARPFGDRLGMPTIAIACFTFWLGPWYLYGP